MTIDDTDQLARKRLTRAFPQVPSDIISSVFAAYRQATDTLPEAVNASHQRLADACSVTSSVRRHDIPGGGSVTVYLSRREIDRLGRGLTLDFEAPDDNSGALSVHIMGERRQRPRP